MTEGKTERVLLLGSTSAIAIAIARELMASSANFFGMIGRDEERVDRVAADLRARGASVATEISETDSAELAVASLERIWAKHGPFDVVIVAQGDMPAQNQLLQDNVQFERLVAVNFTAPAAFCTAVARKLAERGRGTLVVISSVAAVRARKSNFVYGSTKAALEYFVEGLRAQYTDGTAARIITLKPGPTRTRMIAGLPSEPRFVAEPETVARGAIDALGSRPETVCLPRLWGPMMFLLGLLPSRMFRRLPI